MRVLVVEDDPVARSLLVQLLEADGYRVVAVGDGLAALAEAQDFRPHAALIDGNLPDIQGREVARRLRQSSDLPIMFGTPRVRVGRSAASGAWVGVKGGRRPA
jgi:two-component system OmpR family response regulator